MAGAVADAMAGPDAALNGVWTSSVPAVWPLSGTRVTVRIVEPPYGAVSVVAGSMGPLYGVGAGVIRKVCRAALASGPRLLPGAAVMVAMLPSPPTYGRASKLA